MVHRKGIVLVEIHFMECKQFSETNVISHAFQQISDSKIFPKCFTGYWKNKQVTCYLWACRWM